MSCMRVLGLVPLLLGLAMNAQQPWHWAFGQMGQANDIASDPAGFSYVAGLTDQDFMGEPLNGSGGFLAKVSPDGNLIWLQEFENLVLSELELKGATLYATGNGDGSMVIGTDTLHVDTTQHGYVVAAFDTSGIVTWVDLARYNVDMSTGDIEVNDAGEVFIAASGYSPVLFGTDTFSFDPFNRQILVLKYNQFGNLLWLRNAGCTLSKARALGIACDPYGSAYITGFALTDPQDCDSVRFGSLYMTYPSTFFLAKIDGLGDFTWLKHGTNATGNDVEYFSNDSILVTGMFSDSTNAVGATGLTASGSNLFIGSFHLNGSRGWALTSTVTSDSAFSAGIRLDRSDMDGFYLLAHNLHGVLLNGSAVSTLGHSLVVSRFSNSGSVLWSAAMETHPRTQGNYFELHGLSSDAQGQAYVSGQFASQDGPDPFLGWNTNSILATLNTYTLFLGRTSSNLAGMGAVNELSISTYPNPTSDLISIRGASPKALVSFTTLQGAPIESTPLGSMTYDMSHISNGVYILTVTDQALIRSFRVLVMH